MTRIRKRTVRCAVCRRESLHSVILSTNSFGSKDLDFRPPGMMRRTLPLWIQECPHCGYVNTDISEKMPVTPKILNELRNIDLEENNLNIISSIRFYKLYFLKKRLFDLSNKSPDDCSLLVEAFYAVLHAAWICDDKREKKMQSYIVRKLLNFLTNYSSFTHKAKYYFQRTFPWTDFLSSRQIL